MEKVPGKIKTPTKDGHHLDDFINELGSHYGSGNPMKLNHYKSFIKNRGETWIRLNKIFPVIYIYFIRTKVSFFQEQSGNHFKWFITKK